MKDKRIKVFLAAFINQTNAQNLSCRALAKYLDKSKFEVFVLSINHGNLPKIQKIDVRVFNCRFPVKITGPIGYLWGFWKADVVYLPRGLFLNWQKILIKLFKVKSFKTVRNVIDDSALASAMSQFVHKANIDVKQGFDFVDKVYSMTNYMACYNEKRWGLQSEKTTLLPPCDFELFQRNQRIRKQLKKLIFIGNDWQRKGLDVYLRMAQEYLSLEFHIIGEGDQSKYIDFIGQGNIVFHGLLVENQLIEVVKAADLHILPSRSEGLPRVWLETLSNGLPSILFKGYGAEEYLAPNEVGFVLDGYEEVKNVLDRFINEEISIESMSNNCIQLSKKYEPVKLSKKYEEVIEELYYE